MGINFTQGAPPQIIDIPSDYIFKGACDVCGATNVSVARCTSAFGDKEFKYCEKCWIACAEPYDYLVEHIAAKNGKRDFKDEAVIEATLKRLGKGRAKFEKAVGKNNEERDRIDGTAGDGDVAGGCDQNCDNGDGI